jgi:hypothetical protein
MRNSRKPLSQNELQAQFRSKTARNEFCKTAKRGANMPITRLEMVSFTFHLQAKRDRNAGETQPISERGFRFGFDVPIVDPGNLIAVCFS